MAATEPADPGSTSLSGTGIWSPALRYGDPAVGAEAAAVLRARGGAGFFDVP